MKRLAFLASHNGSAARAICAACRSGLIPADPVLLVTNNKDAGALVWASEKKLKSVVVNGGNFGDPDQAIADLLKDHHIDLVLCSGYMRLIGMKTIAAVPAILNIHPALLPHHGGKGMYGSHVHRAVFDNRDTETGATIHLVDREYDRGQIVTQKRIAVDEDDTAETIEAKVKAAEPDFYIETLRKILSGQLSLS